jgi:mRNA-degrading endonuclease RelE of RelBE toxin-antitoxin system
MTSESLSKREIASIRASLSALEIGAIEFLPLESAISLIRGDESPEWLTALPSDRPHAIAESTERYTVRPSAASIPSAVQADEPDWLQGPAVKEDDTSEWLIGMSDHFIKSLRKIDKKLMGRILEAMTHICREPTTPKGDTVTPLTAELKGLWRYRIGDFRLVYQPEAAKKRVTLLTFAGRGSVYP